MTTSIDLERRCDEVLAAMKQDPHLSKYIDSQLKIPAVHRGTDVRLIILGQDPTVKDDRSRKKIIKVLNLKGSGALHNYLTRICLELGIDLAKNVYATNYVKNFFNAPPTQIKQVDVLALAARYWLPVLYDELAQFPDVPIVTLGLPLLKQITVEGVNSEISHYWDHKKHWQIHAPMNWSYLEPHQSILNRNVFPLPHQPSFMRIKFYHNYLPDYLRFAKSKMKLKAN